MHTYITELGVTSYFVTKVHEEITVSLPLLYSKNNDQSKTQSKDIRYSSSIVGVLLACKSHAVGHNVCGSVISRVDKNNCGEAETVAMANHA